MSPGQRNCCIAIEALIHGVHLDRVMARYGVPASTVRAALIFQAYQALRVDLDTIAGIRRGVRQRLINECLLMTQEQTS